MTLGEYMLDMFEREYARLWPDTATGEDLDRIAALCGPPGIQYGPDASRITPDADLRNLLLARTRACMFCCAMPGQWCDPGAPHPTLVPGR